MTLHGLLVEVAGHQPKRGLNQYTAQEYLLRLHGHLLARYGEPLLVGESPAMLQAIAFGDVSRSSRAVEECCPTNWARWNAWPLWLQGEKPDTDELRLGARWLARLEEVLQPRKVFAVGRVAEKCLDLAGVDSTYVPHPGQDKLPRFKEFMAKEVLRGR